MDDKLNLTKTGRKEARKEIEAQQAEIAAKVEQNKEALSLNEDLEYEKFKLDLADAKRRKRAIRSNDESP